METKEKKTDSDKYLDFGKNRYIAVPEKVSKGCKGCDLLDRHCYKSVRATAICRQGYIFKKVN